MSDDMTPTERPIMLSDLNRVRRTVQEIATVQVAIYEELKRGRTWPPVLTVVCLVSAAISVGCALAGLQ